MNRTVFDKLHYELMFKKGEKWKDSVQRFKKNNELHD